MSKLKEKNSEILKNRAFWQNKPFLGKFFEKIQGSFGNFGSVGVWVVNFRREYGRDGASQPFAKYIITENEQKQTRVGQVTHL